MSKRITRAALRGIEQKNAVTQVGPGGDNMALNDNVSNISMRKQPMDNVLEKKSPDIPCEEPVEPSEGASYLDSDSEMGESSSYSLYSHGDSSVTASSMATSVMLTDRVIREENKMEQLERQEELKEKEELKRRKELWLHMDSETREIRYQRLKNLLDRSNFYTEYLIIRMEKQKLMEEKRNEIERKKREKLKVKEERVARIQNAMIKSEEKMDTQFESSPLKEEQSLAKSQEKKSEVENGISHPYSQENKKIPKFESDHSQTRGQKEQHCESVKSPLKNQGKKTPSYLKVENSPFSSQEIVESFDNRNESSSSLMETNLSELISAKSPNVNRENNLSQYESGKSPANSQGKKKASAFKLGRSPINSQENDMSELDSEKSPSSGYGKRMSLRAPVLKSQLSTPSNTPKSIQTRSMPSGFTPKVPSKEDCGDLPEDLLTVKQSITSSESTKPNDMSKSIQTRSTPSRLTPKVPSREDCGDLPEDPITITQNKEEDQTTSVDKDGKDVITSTATEQVNKVSSDKLQEKVSVNNDQLKPDVETGKEHNDVKSPGPVQQDFEDCLREYLGPSVIPEATTQPNNLTTQPNYLGGRKRKINEPADQSKQMAQALTNFCMSSSKKSKLEEDSQQKNEKIEMPKDSAKTTPRSKKQKKLTTGTELPLIPTTDSEGKVVKPILLTGGDLRSYQVEGLNWLKLLFENGVNGILADEMGLGKTIQCIALIAELIYMGCVGPFLVVAPLSTLPNWKAEFARFAPMIPVLFYHGRIDERGSLRRKINKRHKLTPTMTIQPVVLTSYEIAMRDRPHLKSYIWNYLIVDEGHRLKNQNCRLIRELKKYHTSHRLLMTGTPLQNNLSELWSLLNFLLPEVFDDLGSFETWFDVEVISDAAADEAIIREEKKKNILGMLHQILTPFMLRRVKADVDLQIPPKKEILVYAPLSECQKEYYESIVDKTMFNKIKEKREAEGPVELTSAGRPRRSVTRKVIDYRSMLESHDEDSDVESWVEALVENSKPTQKEEKRRSWQSNIRLQNIMMQLRKVCNHPYLLEYPLKTNREYLIDDDIVNKCGKLSVLDKMLTELKARGHKVLIFSQMTKMLDILEDYLYYRDMKYCRLDGSTCVDDRRDAIESFNKDRDMFVFLLSTKAGGLGINLTGADTVIIYDSDWNPQNDLQAQDRCHRIGQTLPVMVYRLVTANTIDHKIVERAAAKRKLEKMVIKKGKFKSGIANYSLEFKPLNPEELMELLKSKDYSRTVGEGRDSVISQEELDALLDRTDVIEEYERVKKGITGNSREDEEDLLLDSKKDIFQLFKTIDFDSGETTHAKAKQ